MIKAWRRGQDNDAVTLNVRGVLGLNESKPYVSSFPLRKNRPYNLACTFRCKIYVDVCRVLL
jgi:hypothetical protein